MDGSLGLVEYRAPYGANNGLRFEWEKNEGRFEWEKNGSRF